MNDFPKPKPKQAAPSTHPFSGAKEKSFPQYLIEKAGPVIKTIGQLIDSAKPIGQSGRFGTASGTKPQK